MLAEAKLSGIDLAGSIQMGREPPICGKTGPVVAYGPSSCDYSEYLRLVLVRADKRTLEESK